MIKYHGKDGDFHETDVEENLPTELEIPLYCMNRILRFLEKPTSRTPPSDKDFEAEKDRYKKTWTKFQIIDKKPFHEIFSTVINRPGNLDARILKLENRFKEQLAITSSQYEEALRDLIEAHKEIRSTVDEWESLSLIKQQNAELTSMRNQWRKQFDEIHNDQRLEYENLFYDLFEGKTDELLDQQLQGKEHEIIQNKQFEVEPSTSTPQTPEIHLTKNQNKHIISLNEMGFTTDDAIAALEISKNDLEQAIMLLVENPQRVQEHTRKGKEKNPMLSKRKSSSLFSLVEPKELREVPKLDWDARKRSLSSPKRLPKAATTSIVQKGSKLAESKENSASNPFEKFLEKAFDAFMVDEESPDSPEKSIHSDTFTFYCGTQHVKVLYNCQLKVQNFDSVFNDAEDELQNSAVKATTEHALYSDNLSGIIVLVREGDLDRYGHDRKLNQGLFNRANKFPELHFEPIRKQIFKALDGQKLREGDYFVTKHSNLPLFHVVFHLVCPNEFVEINGRSNLIIGFRSIIQLCHHCSISNITIPLLLYPAMNRNPEPSQFLKRAEVIFKQSKGVFTESSRSTNVDKSSKQITYLLDPLWESESKFNEIRSSLTSVFRTI